MEGGSSTTTGRRSQPAAVCVPCAAACWLSLQLATLLLPPRPCLPCHLDKAVACTHLTTGLTWPPASNYLSLLPLPSFSSPLHQGVHHVEGKYTSRGPRLIEVNCRMGGGPVRTMNLLAWGVDLVEEQLLASAGGCHWVSGA